MVKFMDLPDVVLLLILEKLPIWKALQLGRLCHRLNHLKRVCFNTRITRLRLFVGSTVNKFVFDHNFADFFHLHGDYDLIIRFASQKTSSSSSSFSIYSNITLSEDWLIKSTDQIGHLGQLLLKITNLTVTLYGIYEYPNCCPSLLACWPKLNSLKVLNYSPNLDFMKHTLPAINSLCCLEHLQADLGLNIENPEQAFGSLFGKLKTFITPDSIKTEHITGENTDRTAWNDENGMIQALERGLDTFGLSKYRYYNDSHLENRTLIRKLKYFQARLDLLDGTEIAKWQLTDWTALQCLHLDFYSKSANSTFQYLLNHLSVLSNLKELHLNLFSDDLSEYIFLENSQHFPIFASVRRFQVRCLLEPHNLPLLAHAFPNANDQLSLRLLIASNTSNADRDSYFRARPELSALCGECKENMKRAIERYGGNIAAFHWFLGQGQNSVLSLIPKVKLFTTEIAGRIRPNYDFIPY